MKLEYWRAQQVHNLLLPISRIQENSFLSDKCNDDFNFVIALARARISDIKSREISLTLNNRR